MNTVTKEQIESLISETKTTLTDEQILDLIGDIQSTLTREQMKELIDLARLKNAGSV